MRGPLFQAMTNLERRRYHRVPLKERCWCEGACTTIYAIIKDVCEGGLFIRTSAPLKQGARTRIRWSLLPGHEEIQADAVVVWSRSDAKSLSDPPGMGLRIEGISSEARERIRDYVRMALSSSD